MHLTLLLLALLPLALTAPIAEPPAAKTATLVDMICGFPHYYTITDLAKSVPTPNFYESMCSHMLAPHTTAEPTALTTRNILPAVSAVPDAENAHVGVDHPVKRHGPHWTPTTTTTATVLTTSTIRDSGHISTVTATSVVATTTTTDTLTPTTSDINPLPTTTGVVGYTSTVLSTSIMATTTTTDTLTPTTSGINPLPTTTGVAVVAEDAHVGVHD